MNNQVGWDNFSREVEQAEENINLGKASLFYAQAQYLYLDIQKYLDTLDFYASDIRTQLPTGFYPLKVIQVINNYLFEKLKFRGNEQDYYNPSNSFLNEVIDRKIGIPITLSVIYLEVAQRLNFPMVGIGMPGHFLIRPEFEDVGIYVDTFNQGEILFEQDCQEKLNRLYQQPVKLEPRFLAPVGKRQILARMLTNLKHIYLHYRNFDAALATINGILILFPDNANEFRDRGLLFYQLNRWQEAIPDLESYLNILPNAEDASVIQALLNKINR
ncbi:MAG: SirB1 family protein [Pleurocapsa sp.]